jgi:ribonuclease P protein component
VRNRIRRRLKEALRAASPLETRADSDYVLMARREALARPFAALVDDMRRAFRAIGRNDNDGRRPADSNPPRGKNRRP